MKLSIGEVSKLYGITSDTLRHYDKIDILKPDINESNGYRYYSYKHLDQLSLILWTKDLGISLREIREFIDKENIDEYRRMIIHQQNILKEKFKALQTIEDKLNETQGILDKIKIFDHKDIIKNIIFENGKFTLYGIDIKNVFDSNKYKEYIGSMEDNIQGLNGEKFYYQCTLDDGRIVYQDENYLFIKDYNVSNKKIKEYFQEANIEVIERRVNGEVARIMFYGDEEEFNTYIDKTIKYIISSGRKLEEDFYVNYMLYMPRKSCEGNYYLEAMFILK